MTQPLAAGDLILHPGSSSATLLCFRHTQPALVNSHSPPLAVPLPRSCPGGSVWPGLLSTHLYTQSHLKAELDSPLAPLHSLSPSCSGPTLS